MAVIIVKTISFHKILIFSAVSFKGKLCVFAYVDAEENCFQIIGLH